MRSLFVLRFAVPFGVRFAASLGVLALAALLVPRAHAQDAAARDTLAVDLTPLLEGASFDDVLDADTPRGEGGERVHLYRYDAQPGDLLHVEMEADGPLALGFGVFEDDVFVEVEAAEDVDGVLTLDVVARRAGPVFFRVAAGEDGTHPYRLAFAGDVGAPDEAAYAPCPALAAGASHNGQLALGATGTTLNPALCALDVAPGATVTLALRSEDFDALVAVGRLVDGYFVPLDFNDDAETSGAAVDAPTDARLVFTTPATGRLYVLVHGGGLDGGAYRLDVTAGGDPGR